MAACVAGAEVLGVLEWPWRVGTVPCRPSPAPEHLRLQCQEAGPERAPGKRQRAEGGLQGRVRSPRPAGLVCAQREVHTQGIAFPAPPAPA